jgi:hypothetical protein
MVQSIVSAGLVASGTAYLMGSTAPMNGQLLQYNTVTNRIEPVTVAGAGIAWGTITGTLSDQADLQAELNAKSDTGHTHIIANVTGLQAALDGKASAVHTHVISDTTGLQTALDGKAALVHTHTIADVTNLQTSLNNKSDVGHTHAQSDVTNLVSDLALKADLVGGVVPTSQIPSIAITEYLGSVANQTAMLALTGQKGDWCSRSDTGTTWVISGTNPAVLGDWTELSYPAAPVTSVNSQTGVVVLSYTDVGAAASSHTHLLSDITNAGTAAAFDDTDFAAASHGHPQSDITDLVSDLAAKAPLASPALTGTPTAPTQTAADNSTKIATTAYVDSAVAGGGGGNVSNSGTPVDNQIAVWTGSNNIEGTASFVYDGSYVDIIDGSNYCVRLGQRTITVGGTTTVPNYGAKISYDFAGKGARFWGEHNGQGSTTLAGSNPVQTGWGGVQTGGASHPSIAGMVRFFANATLAGVIEQTGLWNIQNTLEVRNGTTAQKVGVFKTYTSATSFEKLSLDTAIDAADHRIVVEKGTTGGTYRDLSLGFYDGSTYTESLRLNASDYTVTAATKLLTTASTNSISGFCLPHGTAPDSPNDGDVWTTTSGMYVRVNGVTVGPLGTGGGGGSGTVTSVAVSGTDGIQVDSGSPITTSGTITLGIDAATLRSHINVANGATANAGTVTSVAVSGTDGLQVDSGSPITSSGTITLGVDAATLRSHINVADGATANAGTVTSVAVSGSDGIEVDSGSPVTSSGTVALGVNASTMRSTLGIATGNISATVGDGVNVIAVDTKAFVQVPRDATITGWKVYEVDAVSGSIEFDIWVDSDGNFPPTVADSIVGTEKPAISIGTENNSTTLSGWTTSINAGDWLVFNVKTAPTNSKRVIIKLDVSWT